MQAIKDWGSYVGSSVGSAASEVWQLGVDAKNEAYNVYSEFYNDTADILSSLATDSYTNVTPGKREKSEVDTDDVDVKLDGNTSPSGIFSVEKYTEGHTAPALLMPSAAEIKLKDKQRLSASNTTTNSTETVASDATQNIELKESQESSESVATISLSEAKKISTTTAI